VYFGGPSIDAIPDMRIVTDAYSKIDKARRAGDINGDGYDDLIASYPLSWSGLGSVYIFFGGPDVDSLYDIRLNNWDEPRFHTYFGLDCAGVGDFNGDGINDFAFSLIDGTGIGWVRVYSGTGKYTAVERDDNLPLPETFELQQNYPNPFNAGTVIRFDLRRWAQVTLTVFNIMGQQVKELAKGEYSRGEHTVAWDGLDDRGESVGSGLYLYRLRANEFEQVRKMVMVK
jgi:hypothetical protein